MMQSFQLSPYYLSNELEILIRDFICFLGLTKIASPALPFC